MIEYKSRLYISYNITLKHLHMNITIELGKQDPDRGRRPAISLIKPKNNNSTELIAVIDPRNKDARFKKQLAERFGCKPIILLQGDLFSRSPFVKHHLLIEEYKSYKHVADLKKEVPDLFYQQDASIHHDPLVPQDQKFIIYRIVRPTKEPEHVVWQDNRLHEFGLEPSFLQLLDKRNNITPKRLKQLRAEIMELYKNKAFNNKTVTETVRRIFTKYRLYNVGAIKHRILEAGRVAMKSIEWMKLTSFLLPKYTRYLIDMATPIENCLDALQQHTQQPDVVLYEQFPMIFSKLPWKDQVQDTIRYWINTDMFNIDDRWEQRFEVYAKVFEARQMQNDTMLVTKDPITNNPDAQTLFAKKIMLNLCNIDPDYIGEHSMAFTHEYNREKNTIELLQQFFQRNNTMLVEGYGFKVLTEKSILVIPNLQLKRYAYYLAFQCSDEFPINNIKLYDGNPTYSACFGNESQDRIYLFAADLWPAKILTRCLKLLSLRFRMKKKYKEIATAIHILGDNNMASYCSPRFDMKPIFRYLQGYSFNLDKMQVLKDQHKVYWFPKPQEVVPKPSQSITNEVHFKTNKEFDVWLQDTVFNEDNMNKADKQSWNSYVFLVFDEAMRKQCLEEFAALFGIGKYQFKVNDRVMTPEGFMTQIKKISNNGCNAMTAWKNNYEDYVIFVQNPFHSMTQQYHPTQLNEALVARFHSGLTAPINKAIFYGRWPRHGIEEARKMVYGEIIIHPSCKVEDWNKSNVSYPRKNCYGAILAEQRKAHEAAEREAEETARQAARLAEEERKKALFAKVRQRDQAKNDERDKKRQKNEISSLSRKDLQQVQEKDAPNAL